MWRYEQSTGRLWHLVGTGYSGREEALNQPDLDGVRDRGPLPRGRWSIGGPREDGAHGPYVLPLTAELGTDTHGRSAFLIHGDLVHGPPFSASHGCLIFPHDVRVLVWTSGDHELEVVR